MPNPHADTDYVARFTAPEFTTLCPITGQPDFAHLVIDYVPGKWLVESKSLKLYLNSFRNHGAFHEDCTVAIGKRLFDLLKPKWLRIGGYWYPRGGMPIDVFWQAGKLPAGRLGAGPGRRALSRARLRPGNSHRSPGQARAFHASTHVCLIGIRRRQAHDRQGIVSACRCRARRQSTWRATAVLIVIACGRNPDVPDALRPRQARDVRSARSGAWRRGAQLRIGQRSGR